MKLFKERKIHHFNEIKIFENKTYWSLVVLNTNVVSYKLKVQSLQVNDYGCSSFRQSSKLLFQIKGLQLYVVKSNDLTISIIDNLNMKLNTHTIQTFKIARTTNLNGNLLVIFGSDGK